MFGQIVSHLLVPLRPQLKFAQAGDEPIVGAGARFSRSISAVLALRMILSRRDSRHRRLRRRISHVLQVRVDAALIEVRRLVGYRGLRPRRDRQPHRLEGVLQLVRIDHGLPYAVWLGGAPCPPRYMEVVYSRTAARARPGTLRRNDPPPGRSAVQSGGSLPSLKPGEILGAGALADRAALSPLAAGVAFGSGLAPRPPRASLKPRATERGEERAETCRLR